MANRALVGLDIGHKNARAVFVQPRRDGIRIAGSGAIELVEADVSEDEDMAISEVEVDLGQVLRELWKSSRISSKQVVVGTSRIRTVTRLVGFPRMPLKELQQVVGIEAERHLPLDADNLVTDFSVSGKSLSEDQVQIVLVGTSRSEISALLRSLKSAGVQAVAVDVSSVAAYRALANPNLNIAGIDDSEPVRDPESRDAVVMIDLGYDDSRVNVFEGRIPLLSRTIPIGGRSFTLGLAKARGMKYSDAEHAKRELGVTKSTSWRSPLLNDLEPVLQQLGRQLVQSLQYFAGEYRGVNISAVYLHGGTAAMPGLTDHVAEFLDEYGGDRIPWRGEAPEVKLVGDISDGSTTLSGVEYLTAVGLGMWGVTA